MENRNYIDELVIKSLQNDLSGEEETILAQWLNAGEQNRKHYEALQQAWQLSTVQHTIAAIEPEEEWERFQRSVRRPFYGRIAVAASVLVLIMAGWFWWKPVIKTPVVQKTETPRFITRKEINRSDTTQLYLLPDGSQAWLASNSELSWQEPFTGKRRDVYMKGVARFKAAKDSTRPFTVLVSKLSVTALGTLFAINDQEKTISVRLHEGRVVVRGTGKDIYLLPGQELVYNKVSNTSRFTKTSVKQPARVDELPLPDNDHGNWYMFNNQSLADVFDNLEEIFEVEIVYNAADLQKLYFIGKFSKSDSIETILRQITTLNHLTVVKENNAYIIRK